MDSYHRYPLLRFHSVKYTILLALLPLVVWLLIPNRGSEAEPMTEKKVKTETIKSIDFEARWFPIYDPPRRVRTIPIMQPVKEEVKTEEQSARPLVAPVDRSNNDVGHAIEDRSSSVRRTKRLNIRYAYRDICARHKMRRVVTNGGRSWRCRRV